MTPTHWATPLLAAIALAAAGCSSPTIADAVNDVIQGSGLSYASCGTYQIIQDECSTSATTPPSAIQCLIDAAAACKPAHLTITRGTLEGDPIHTAYVVSPAEGGCSVIMIVDTREDRFGGQEMTTSRCATFAKVDACPWVAASRCVEM